MFPSNGSNKGYFSVLSSQIPVQNSAELKTQCQSHIATGGHSVSKSWYRAPSGAHGQICITVWQLRSCFCGTPSLTRGRICLFYMLLALASAVSNATIFYCLRFETSLFVASYDSQGHGGGIRPRLHTGMKLVWICAFLITSRRHGPLRKHSVSIVILQLFHY
jgi:hypothetical protein